MPDTFGNAAVTWRNTCAAAAGRERTVAMLLCGAWASSPGLAIMAKLMPSVRQAMSRRLAMRRSMSRPSTLTRSVSPMPTCQPFARPASNDTSGGPL